MKWLGFILISSGCTLLTDFDRFEYRDEFDAGWEGEAGQDAAMSMPVEAGQIVDASPMADSGPITMIRPDASISQDAGQAWTLNGSWRITRQSEPIKCGGQFPPYTYSRGPYTDTWLIGTTGPIVAVSVMSSDWPVEEYKGSWDGVTLILSGEGGGPVDNVHKEVTSKFTLTVKDGQLIGSENSTADDCKQTRTVTGVRL